MFAVQLTKDFILNIYHYTPCVLVISYKILINWKVCRSDQQLLVASGKNYVNLK